jgi:cell wall-associated NlpC family hydrolase
VLELLADKGLLAPAAPAGLLQQARDRTTEMAIAALDFVGVRYRRGGTSAETGFDCSGFTRHVFEMSLGMVLPRRADEQAGAPGLIAVKREDLQPGDLVFFNTLRHTFSHVGIYIGAGRFVHAPHTGAQVRTDDIGFAYWAKRFTGARRIVTTAAVVPETVGPAAPAEEAGS